MTVDLHCGQIQGFFHNTPVDNLWAEGEFYLLPPVYLARILTLLLSLKVNSSTH